LVICNLKFETYSREEFGWDSQRSLSVPRRPRSRFLRDRGFGNNECLDVLLDCSDVNRRGPTSRSLILPIFFANRIGVLPVWKPLRVVSMTEFPSALNLKVAAQGSCGGAFADCEAQVFPRTKASRNRYPAPECASWGRGWRTPPISAWSTTWRWAGAAVEHAMSLDPERYAQTSVEGCLDRKTRYLVASRRDNIKKTYGIRNTMYQPQAMALEALAIPWDSAPPSKELAK